MRAIFWPVSSSVHLCSAGGAPALDVSHAPLDVVKTLLQNMSYRDRFTCTLVCKAWAEAAAATTRSINLKHKVQDLSSLELWLDKHGSSLEGLQLHSCNTEAVLMGAAPSPSTRIAAAQCLPSHRPLQPLTNLTLLRVQKLWVEPPDMCPPLQLPGLQHSQFSGWFSPVTTTYLTLCTQLRVLEVLESCIEGSGSLVASTMLQDPRLIDCSFGYHDEGTDSTAWQYHISICPASALLPHLTSQQL